MDDKKRLDICIGRLIAAFQIEPDPATITVYLEELEIFPVEVVEKAMRTWVREMKWFPKICELREWIEEGMKTHPTDVPRIEDKRDEERFADPEEVRRFVASLDRRGIAKPVPEAEPEERASPVLKGREARRFEGSRRKAKEKAKEMGWEV